MGKDKEFSDELQKHLANQTKLGNSYSEVIIKAKDRVQSNFNDKKMRVREQINRLLNKEKESLQELASIESQSNEELLKISTQTDTKEGIDFTDNSERIKNQQISSIWNDTLQEIDIIFNKQKDQIKRLDQNKSERQLTPQPTRAFSLNVLLEQEKLILEKKSKNVNEFVKKLDKCRKDVDQIVAQIENIDKLEKEKIKRVVDKSNTSEENDKKKSSKKFLDIFKRHAKSADDMN